MGRGRADVDTDAVEVERLLALDEAQAVDALVLGGHLVLVLGVIEFMDVADMAGGSAFLPTHKRGVLPSPVLDS